MDMNAEKNQLKSFEYVATSDASFITASEGLITMKEMDNIEDCPLLESTTPVEGQALPIVNVRQSNVLHFGLEKEGIGKSKLLRRKIIHYWSALHPYRGRRYL